MKRALLIGINYYNTASELSGCHNDVYNIRKLLRNYEVKTLIDDPEDKNFSSPYAPTKDNILNSLQKIITVSKPGDRIYIHYSGHGTWIPDLNSDERDKRDEAICPCDYEESGLIIDDTLRKLINTLPAGVQVRAVFDCCFSGSVLDLPYRYSEFGKIAVENSTPLAADVIMISGCRDDQTSADTYINKQYTGALTWSVLETIKEVSAVNKKFTWKEIIYSIRYKLKTKYEQIPQINFSDKKGLATYYDL